MAKKGELKNSGGGVWTLDEAMVIVLYRKGNSFQCDRIIETCALVFDNAFCTMGISRYTVARCTWSVVTALLLLSLFCKAAGSLPGIQCGNRQDMNLQSVKVRKDNRKQPGINVYIYVSRYRASVSHKILISYYLLWL